MPFVSLNVGKRNRGVVAGKHPGGVRNYSCSGFGNLLPRSHVYGDDGREITSGTREDGKGPRVSRSRPLSCGAVGQLASESQRLNRRQALALPFLAACWLVVRSPPSGARPVVRICDAEGKSQKRQTPKGKYPRGEETAGKVG